MHSQSRWIPVLGLAAVVAFAAEPAHSDTVLKTALRTSSVVIMGQEMPGQSDTSTTWISSDRAYQDHGDGTGALYMVSDSTYYLIDHDNRSVFPVDLTKGMDYTALFGGELPDTNEAGDPLTAEEKIEQEKAMAEMSLMAQAMMEAATVEVEATDDTMTFRNWQAHKYTLDITLAGMQSKGELWATTAAPEVYQLFQRLAYAQMAASPGFDRLLEQISEVEGVTVYSKSVMTIMGVNVEVVSELLEMSEAQAPEGTYELPEDYTVTTKD